jgi:hypothetical protein
MTFASQLIAVSAVAFATLFMIPVAQAASVCQDVFRPAFEPTVAEAAKVESSAIAVLARMELAPKEAEDDVRLWIDDEITRLDRGEIPSVMDHSTLLHIYRTGFLEQFDPELARSLGPAIEKSWKRLTGSEIPLDKILTTKLPREVLSRASEQALRYHEAVFESPSHIVADTDATSPSKIKKFLAATTMLAVGIAAHHNVPGAQVLAGALTGYAVSAMTEYLIHRFRLHATKPTLDFLRRRLGEKFLFAYRFHTGHQHRMFTPQKYSVETNREWLSGVPLADKPGLRAIERNDVLAEKQGDSPSALHNNQYGMSMSRYEIIEASVGTISIATVASYLFGFGHDGIAAAALTAPATAFATAYLHPYLHTPAEMIREKSSVAIRLLVGTRYWQLVSRLHYVHHVAPTKANFSLFLPGPDWFFNTLKNPDVGTLVRMEQMGIIF